VPVFVADGAVIVRVFVGVEDDKGPISVGMRFVLQDIMAIAQKTAAENTVILILFFIFETSQLFDL
jgi:hypothetical protein